MVTREIRLDPTDQAPGTARRFIARTLCGLGCAEFVEDAELMVSELVTNARIHAEESPLWVHVCQSGPFLFLEVWDRSPKPPMFLEPGLMSEGGRGLHVVQELSRGFGCHTFPHGKVVWALVGILGRDYWQWRNAQESLPAGFPSGTEGMKISDAAS